MNPQEIENIQKLDAVIKDALAALAGFDEGSDEYTKTVNQLKTLYGIKENYASIETKEIETETKKKVSEAELRIKDIELEARMNAAKAELRINELESQMQLRSAEAELKLKELEIQDKEKAYFWKLPVKTETLVPVIGSLVGIVIVVAYEHTHIVTSKALGMVTNIRR
jgi:hypothetical protein